MTYVATFINFGTGTTFVLVIDTDSYSGNFERQMAAYVIGAYDEDRYHGFNECLQFREDGEEPAAPPLLQELSESVMTLPHTEYGHVSNTIWATPGRLNDGYGGHFDAAEGQKGFPAYESVAVFLEVEPTAEQLALIQERAVAYGTNRTNFSGEPDPVQIKGVRVIKVETETKTTVTQSITAL